MTSETPFAIAIPDRKLEALKARLELALFPDELDDAGLEYGAPLADAKRLAGHRKDSYLPKWREHEAKLNQELPQFTKEIEAERLGKFDIHYVHQRSTLQSWGAHITRRIAELYGPKHTKACQSVAHEYADLRLASQWRASSSSPTDCSASFLVSSQDIHPRRKLGLNEWSGSRSGAAGITTSSRPNHRPWVVNWIDDYPWTDDEVLTWVSVYRFSTAGPAALDSIRIYYEVFKALPHWAFPNRVVTPIPVGYSYFPNDIMPLPQR
ncbi:hypothetical protein DFP72DRAFT_1118398 [Ephemerocybe angulata]|uniref:Epoxide hydrolase N-terminal domain-containing protein n=1 Tax=Ephemerocybe angulata TaxID=980116 RepID=A0A8H6M7F4_9AGAR|nr:hypothetical protein DFP72DRAFT_1118398 [Tulosesus angulatus]